MHVFERLLHAGEGLALCLVLAALPFSASARGNEARLGPANAADSEPGIDAHIQRQPLTWDQLAPLPLSRAHLFRSYDDPELPQRALGSSCDINSFANASGNALVALVRAAPESCFQASGLFSLSGPLAGQVFPESKMIAVANAMRADAASYPGNNDQHMLQLVSFLRTGLYVQFYHSSAVGAYSTAWTQAIRPALHAFVANSHFQDVNDSHGRVLMEFVILIDSSVENAQHIDTVRGVLDRYGPSWADFWYMKAATNQVFFMLFRGHQDPAFQAAVQGSGSGITDTLVSFINDNRAADVGTDREFLLQNAAGELGRFTRYSDASFHDLTHPKVKSVLDQFGITGAGAGIYVRLASVTDYYDHAHCSYFGLCNFVQDLQAQILPAANARDCSATLRVRSQALTPAQLDTVCSLVGNQERYFHAQAQTGNTPVPNDLNARLEMVIFHSSSDYQSYSSAIFGNSSSNGGIYLEGDPANPANQPRFLAYEAEWLRPNFEVWNLTHEYIHYLDGRYNWHGRFGDMPLQAPYSAIWFIEGFAEYMSYSYRKLNFASALSEAEDPDKFTLAQLFDNEYGDQARTYMWGYMATRFMFERHRDKITSLFAVSRPGDYNPGYRTWLDQLRSSYNAEFRAWVVCFAEHDGDTSASNCDSMFGSGFEPRVVPECTLSEVIQLDNGCKRSNLSAANPNERVFLAAYVPAGRSSVSFSMSGGTGDADLYVRAGAWPTETEYDAAPLLVGNTESVTLLNPVLGWHYLMLKPRTSAFAGVEVVADWR